MEGKRLVFHVDVNSAFLSWSSVERLKNDSDAQDLRLIPSAVGGDPKKRTGVVLAKSVPAKKFGIRTGEPLAYAFRKCPHLTVIPPDFRLYSRASASMMELLAEYAPVVEKFSIDEAFLHLEGIEPEKIPVLCRDLVDKIRKWVGVPVSIGVAPTKTLAKIASHFAKKYKGYKGVCMMDTEAKRLKALELTPIDDVWGIGRRLAPKMLEKNVRTALDFVQRPCEWVASNFNINTVRTWEELRGHVCHEEEREERRKSICTSRSFADMIEDERELVLRISDFAAMCAQKLREEGSAAYDVTTFMYTNRFRDDLAQYFPSVTIRLDVAANSAQEIVGAALKAFRTIFRQGYKYKKAGVIVSNIIASDAIQASIFDFDDELRQKHDRLSKVMDAVNSAAEASGSASGRSMLRLATQRPGHYADGIRSDFRSRLYSTSLDDIIEIH